MNIKSPPRRPVPRLTRKSTKEMQAWRHAKMRDEINEEKALRAGMATQERAFQNG